MRLYPKRGHAPPQRPIILVPPFFGKEMRFEKDGQIDVDLLFFWDFQRYLPHTLLALRLAGQEGIGSLRHYHENRFEIGKPRCNFSGKKIFDGATINLMNLRSVDIQDIPPFEDERMVVGFKTPYKDIVFLLNLIAFSAKLETDWLDS